MFTVSRDTHLGITSASVRFSLPVPLTTTLLTTTTHAGQPLEAGELPVGALVNGMSMTETSAHVWLVVSTDGGRTWWANERADALGPVLEALGMDALAKCDGCGLPYATSEGRDDAQGSRLCAHCQQQSAREDERMSERGSLFE